MYMNVQLLHLLSMSNTRTFLQNTAYERHLYQTMKSGLCVCVCARARASVYVVHLFVWTMKRIVLYMYREQMWHWGVEWTQLPKDIAKSPGEVINASLRVVRSQNFPE